MWFHERRQARQPVGPDLLLTCLVFITLVSAQCLPYPIAIPIGNVTLSNGGIARGAELAIGHPPQSLAFLPQWPLNNTLVYGTDGYCTDPALSPAGCITWRGGQYALLSSDTRRQPPNPNPTDGPPYPGTTTYTDVLKINDNVTLDSFAIGVPLSDWQQQGYHPMMALGLGANSTLLSSLVAGKQIASRVWSMFYGLTGANSNAQLEGSLVFGGYDRAKVSGEGYTQKLWSDRRCSTQMLVTIDDIILNFPNGTDASIVASTTNGSFSACIVPDYPGLITLANNPYFEMFQIVTNTGIIERSFGQEFYTSLYSDGYEPYQGDLSIKIRHGPSIRIPNNQLVIPERYIDDSTGEVMANYSRSNLVINPLNTINQFDLSQLGRLFLSSAYVMLNQDSEQFTIWAANPTTFEDLVGVDSTGKEVTTFCTQSIAPASSGPTSAPTKKPTVPRKGLSTGAIAGIGVGTVAAFIIVVVVLFWCRHRIRTRATGQPGSQIAAQGVHEKPSDYSNHPMGAQIPSEVEPRELHGISSIYEPAELAGGISGQIQPSILSGQRFELGG
ncbi:hypothetical protein CIB48_g6338 [Xylaria polymorpha]|nr:hypothetical protein CIB48_g6338 [Xylaria polymorpha]